MSDSLRQRAIYLQKEFELDGIIKDKSTKPLRKVTKLVKSKIREWMNKKPTHNKASFRGFCQMVVEHRYFKGFMMFTILFNIIVICINLSNADRRTPERWSVIANCIFIGIYSFEFGVRFYVDIFYYTRSGYDFFDIVILFLSYLDMIYGSKIPNSSIFKVLRSLRALRIFRSIGFLRKLRLIIDALGKTLRNSVFNVTMLLVLMMFIFAILGCNMFSNTQEFSDLKSAFFALFRYVTAESWMEVQDSLTKHGYSGSQWFSVVFMFIANTVLTNLFIGVICENIDEATAADEDEQMNKRLKQQREKRQLLAKKQEEDMKKLFGKKLDAEIDAKEVEDLLEKMAGNLENDLTPMRHQYFNPTWMNAYLITLKNKMQLIMKQQQGYIQLVNSLKEMQDVLNEDKKSE
eukprot:NODE_208_length_12861_cov_0.800972.p2 type:complete len:405 gc:universal NODE_208_length_12861_cov_0.800972:4408-5622(+)